VLCAHSSSSCATTDGRADWRACTGFALRGWVGGSSARVRRSTLRAAQPASPPQRPAALATASQRLHCLGVSQCKVVQVRLAIGSDDTTRRVAVQHAMAVGARQVGSVRDQLRDAHEGMLDAGNAIQETAAAPPQKSSPPFRRSFAFAPRGMRSVQSCARCLCGSARLGTCCALHAEQRCVVR
jgi:hypothetical protein